MKNLKQIRAGAALGFWNENKLARGVAGGNVVSKLGSLIIRDGLLSTLAFCVAKGDGHGCLGNNVVQFVLSRLNVEHQKQSLAKCITTFTEMDSAILRLATQEALRYLDYLKRFEPNQSDSGREE